MAHKRKARKTHLKGQPNGNAVADGKTNPAARVPRSMVIRMGASDVGSSVSQLVKDVRSVMEPHTASRLRERRSNRLRDFTTMAGPLGVTHFLLFYRAPSRNTNMKLAITPRGPTLNFHVERYSLSRDIAKSQRHPKTGGAGMDHMTPPLLVMNNFTTPPTNPQNQTKNFMPKHLESLTTSTFQSLFPPISPQRTPLPSIRRVLLINRERELPPPNHPTSSDPERPAPYTLNFRHYAIITKPLLPLPRPLKRLHTASQHAKTRTQKPQAQDYPENHDTTTEQAGGDTGHAKSMRSTNNKARKGGLPDLSRFSDVADYILPAGEGGTGGGYTSASESEADLSAAEVEVLEGDVRKVGSKKEREEKRRALETAASRATEAETESEAEADEEDAGREDKGRRGAPKMQKRALKLTEIGPRMRLRLYKVEEGLCGGRVLWHESVEKSREEEVEMERVWEGRRREREERRRVQRENVERKRREKGGRDGDEKGDGGQRNEDEAEPWEDEEMVESDLEDRLLDEEGEAQLEQDGDGEGNDDVMEVET